MSVGEPLWKAVDGDSSVVLERTDDGWVLVFQGAQQFRLNRGDLLDLYHELGEQLAASAPIATATEERR